MPRDGNLPPDGPDTSLDFQSPDFQRRLNDFFPGIIYVYDVGSHKLNYVNKKVTDLLGYSFEDIKVWDNDFSKFVFKDDVDLVREELEKFNTLQDEESHSYLCRFNKKGGDWLHFQVSGKVLRRDSSGKPSSILFVAQDIQEQIKRQEELRALHELSEDNEELLQFGNWTWNPKSDQLVWTKGMYTLMNLPSDSDSKPITLNAYLSQIPEEDREPIVNLLLALPKKKEATVEFKYRILTHDGVEKIFFSKGKVLYAEDGTVSKIVGTTRDITQIGRYEQELERKISELDHSNRELEDFAYAASHDLQEPLRKISTLGDRLQSKFSDSLPEDGLKYLERIRAASRNAQALIDSLMEFSRITHSALTFERIDLNAILAEVRSDLELKIEETNTTMKWSNLPSIDASALQIRQLFTNIILNSIKFRRAGSPCLIEIEARKLNPAEIVEYRLRRGIQYYAITIKDNGIGFEEIYSTIIFHMFSRLHGKSEYPGAGIGLALCKKIAEAHNGIIFAQGTPGEGATFSVILPEIQPK